MILKLNFVNREIRLVCLDKFSYYYIIIILYISKINIMN